MTESELAINFEESYLRVIIDSTMKTSASYSEELKKANKALGIIKKEERMKEKTPLCHFITP